nr:hypothetical protein [Tanacetum cinerariifolium]
MFRYSRKKKKMGKRVRCSHSKEMKFKVTSTHIHVVKMFLFGRNHFSYTVTNVGMLFVLVFLAAIQIRCIQQGRYDVFAAELYKGPGRLTDLYAISKRHHMPYVRINSRNILDNTIIFMSCYEEKKLIVRAYDDLNYAKRLLTADRRVSTANVDILMLLMDLVGPQETMGLYVSIVGYLLLLGLSTRLNVPTRQILDSKGAIPSMNATDERKSSRIWLIILKNGIMERLLGIEDVNHAMNPTTLRIVHLKKNGKHFKKLFGVPFPKGGRYRAAAPGFYQRDNANPSYQEQRQRMEESLCKFMAESAKRHDEKSNLIKEI